MLKVRPSIEMLYPAFSLIKAEQQQTVPTLPATNPSAPAAAPAAAATSRPRGTQINNSINIIMDFNNFLKQLSNSIRKQNPYLRQIGEIYKNLQQIIQNPKSINNFKLDALARRLQSIVQPTLQKLIIEETNDLSGLQKAITDIQGFIGTVAPAAGAALSAPAISGSPTSPASPSRLTPPRPTAEQGGYGWNPNETVMRNVGRNLGRFTTSPFRGMKEFFGGYGRGGLSPAVAPAARRASGVVTPKMGSANYLFGIED